MLSVHFKTVALTTLPIPKNNLLCTNIKNHKLKIFYCNTKVIVWYKNNKNKATKITGILENSTDSTITMQDKKSFGALNIPLQNIISISHRNNKKLILSAITFIPSTIISGFVIKLLSRVNKNNNSPGFIPNDGNGLAGVIGIVLGLIFFPIFIISSIVLAKQLLHKKISVTNGWIFSKYN